MSRCCLFLYIILFFSGTTNASETDELQIIRKNYIQALVNFNQEPPGLIALLNRIPVEVEISDQMVAELHQRYPFDLAKMDYMNKIQSDGSWADINYNDQKRSGWEPKLHAERILELVKLYRSDQTSYHRSAWLEEEIHKALNFWFTAKPVSLNWWQNEIGIPKTLGSAFILFEDKLTPTEKEKAIEVMSKAEFGKTGQNKVWLAGNVMIRALLQNDYNLVRKARDEIASEITIGQEEGIKEDWSFHQHGPQQQFGNYGLAFISGMSFFSSVFSGTFLEFDDQQMDILCSLLERGYRPILWNGYMDISSLGRQLFNNAQVHKAFCVAFAASELTNSGYPEATKVAQQILTDNFDTTGNNSFTGHHYFRNSLYSIHRRPRWMSSLKMSSNQIIGTEQVNEDNLNGYYLGDGATYFYVRGDEYLNDFPFWDWRKVPGTTAYESPNPLPRVKKDKNRNEADFVAGVTNGQVGLAAMELNRDGLHARKAWIFTDQFVFCMGSDIRSDSTLAVTSAIDQRGQHGALSFLNGEKWDVVQGEQRYAASNLRFFHDNTGYVLLSHNTCVAQSVKRSGQWSDFMQMYRPKQEEKEMISLHLDHGVKPQQAGYRYIVLPDSDLEKTAAFDIASIRILKDDSEAQIIFLSDINAYFIVAFKPMRFDLNPNFPFEAKEAGVYLITQANDTRQIYFEGIPEKL